MKTLLVINFQKIQQVLLEKYNIKLSLEFVKFFISGSTAFISDFVTLNILFYVFGLKSYIYFNILNTQLSLSVANAISTLVGISVTFSLNRYWAFKQNKDKPLHHVAGKFFIVILFNYIISNILFGLITTYLGIIVPITKVIVSALQMLWTFFLYKLFVFKK